MDRSDEFGRIVSIFASPGVQSMPIPQASTYVRLASQVSVTLNNNDVLIGRMVVLADRKEFSNDPTTVMSEISEQFEDGVTRVQAELGRMKGMTDSMQQSAVSAQQQQHYKLLKDGLMKRVANHVETFQTAIKTHTAHVQARNGRVGRYGATTVQTTNTTNVGVSSPHSSIANFAMFQAPPRPAVVQTSPLKMTDVASPQVNVSVPAVVVKNGVPMAPGTRGATNLPSTALDAELRNRGTSQIAPPDPPVFQNTIASRHAYTQRRSANSYDTTSSGHDAYGAGGYLHVEDDPQAKGSKLLQERGRNTLRLRGAEKVEATLVQMGSLFTQMAGLVMEQGETLTRIEDDVEAGLEQTVAAHKEMEYFYEISKGNRGLIIKIFLLMIFFAYLFLKWT